jgi:S-adenosylmethionine:tRNA ribosyltransferase-isomerase
VITEAKAVNNLWINCELMKNSTSIPTIPIADYDYNLPLESIAEQPLAERDLSKLLIWRNGLIKHDQYLNLAQYLPTNSHLVFNDTRVIAARLKFIKNTGGSIEIFLLEPAHGLYAALHDQYQSEWKCMVGGMKKWKQGEILELIYDYAGNKAVIKASLKERKEDHAIISFTWDSALPFHELLTLAGKIPLPPYIKRMATEQDATRYQTVYAQHEGSVAAPTAGLHFTERMFRDLDAHSISHSFVTLHVGAGTFKPVTSATIADHQMHEEFFDVELSLIQSMCDKNKIVIAVGTTSTRTLESLYWIGMQLMLKKDDEDLTQVHLGQWDHLALTHESMPDRELVFTFLSTFMERKKMNSIKGHTGICITPGYKFRVISGLITNFHQPQSTLLLLIAAIMGDDWKRTYEIALKEHYRFLSYGDGSLLFIE